MIAAPDMVALIAAAVAVLFLRLGWRRRPLLVGLGWAIASAALTVLTWRWGAWGLSVGTLVGIAAALVILMREALAAPEGHRAPERATATKPASGRRIEGLGRRVAVFLLVVPAGLAATELLALGAEAAARRAGWVEADTTVLALMAQPLAWALLASVQLIAPGPRAMVAPALLCAAAGGLLWLL
ncbi:MAG: hypothetical protein ACTHMG_15455 [Sphingomonas sp.]